MKNILKELFVSFRRRSCAVVLINVFSVVVCVSSPLRLRRRLCIASIVVCALPPHHLQSVLICASPLHCLRSIFVTTSSPSTMMSSPSVYAGKKEDRMMMTRLHIVVDIYFVKCGSYVGWRYARRKHLCGLRQDSVYARKKEDRMMMTRLHTVVDIYFGKYGSYVGWRYSRRKHFCRQRQECICWEDRMMMTRLHTVVHTYFVKCGSYVGWR
ncbi:hypothetical protein IGI04_014556 [Brassica rapa subsp. trilocularis]|uniref:Yippee domain-containing protein n=1 Tax=Brassica rapa subsp. trilocularis TaxID=1813537 RepID=A0ABQ7MMI8_BRACM|nr:hypothetical protein IGI04_014556 [Brassica rapa subsp. trilocularis]